MIFIGKSEKQILQYKFRRLAMLHDARQQFLLEKCELRHLPFNVG